MAFEYEVGKTYLNEVGNGVTIESRNPEYRAGPLVYGRTADGSGTWYSERTGIDLLRPPLSSLTQQLVPPPTPPPLVFEEGECYVDGAGTVVRILLIREYADELLAEVEGKPACPVRRYQLNGKSRGSFEHLVAAAPSACTPPAINFPVFHNGCRLQPNPATMTPYQSLLLCRFLQYYAGDVELPSLTIAAIFEATKEHWSTK